MFKDFYFALINHFSEFLSVSRIQGVSFPVLNIMKGVGRNPKNEGKKKGGLKVHMMIDAHSETAKFVRISESKVTRQKLSKIFNSAHLKYDCV